MKKNVRIALGGRFKVADAKSEIFLPALEERNSRVVICFFFRG